MSDYIRREDALNECETLTPIDAGILKRRMRVIQGIDIVRCKECRHWCNHKDADYDQSGFIYYCEMHGINISGNDYCSFGEREGE